MTNMVISTVYDTLITYDSTNKVVGDLATDFTFNADASALNVTLSSKATFHDGSPVTASDVKFSLDRYMAVGAGVAGLIKGYASTTVTDPTHLTINLSGPNALFLGSLSKAYIMEAAVVQAHAGTDQGQAYLQTNDAGSGPFVTTGSPVTGDVVVNRYDKYWQYDPARPASLTFKRIDQSATQLAELKAGNIDIAQNLSSTDAATLTGSSSVTVAYLPVASQAILAFNTSTGPTANVAVRKALALAFNYQGGLDKIFGGKGKIANGPLQAPLACGLTGPPFAQDLTQAKKLLADAGVSNLTITMRFQPVFPTQAAEATLYQSDLKTIGVTVNLVPIAFADYLTLLSSKDTIPEVMLENDFALIPDPGTVLLSGFGSKSIGTNHTAYSNPAVDDLLAKAAANPDEAARCALYQQAETLIQADVPQATLYQVDGIVGYKTGLKGVTVSSTVNPIALAGLRTT
jgi:peptide/nickel transport system substrate-binding protein